MLNRGPNPPWALAMEAATSTATSTGGSNGLQRTDKHLAQDAHSCPLREKHAKQHTNHQSDKDAHDEADSRQSLEKRNDFHATKVQLFNEKAYLHNSKKYINKHSKNTRKGSDCLSKHLPLPMQSTSV